MRVWAGAGVCMGAFVALCIQLHCQRESCTGPVHRGLAAHRDSAPQQTPGVSPGKPGAVLDIKLWKDVDRNSASLRITVENTSNEER